MPKAIPVFVFAFAAYAATSARRAQPPSPRPAPEDSSAALFLAFYHLLSRSNAAHVIVKIAPGEPLPPGAIFPAEGTAYWLGDLVESAGGLQGRVVVAPTRRRRIKRGQIVEFSANQILGWSVPSEEAKFEFAPRKAPAAPLAFPDQG